MESLQLTAVHALKTMLAGQPTTGAKVAFAWQIAAGPALGRATTPSWSEDGTLFVQAKTEAWRKEIRRAIPVVKERLGHLLGPGVVRRIVIKEAKDA